MCKKSRIGIFQKASKIYECYQKQTDEYQSRQLILSDSTGAINLCDVTYDQYDELIGKILGYSDFKNRFSVKFIAEKVKPILISGMLKCSEKCIEKELGNLVSDLESFNEEKVVYQIPFGIQMIDVEELQVGKVYIKKLSDEDLDNLCSQIQERVNQNFHKEISEDVRKDFCNRVLIEYLVNAEPIRATEMAEEESYKAFDLLGFSILLFEQLREKISIGLAGDVLYTVRTTHVIGQHMGYTRNSKAVGTYDLKITKKFISRMQKVGIMELSQNIRDESLSSFKKTLLQGIHWFTSAHYQPEPANAILNLITSLETFLNTGDGSIQNNVTTLETRKSLKKKVKKYYGIRSGLTHGGDKKVTANDVNGLSEIVTIFLVKMLKRRNEFKKQQDLLDWIIDQKFLTP